VLNRVLPLLAALLVGAATAIQGPINSELSRHVGQFRAVFISVLLSFVTVTIIMLLTGGPGFLGAARHAPPWALVGGFMGIIALTGTIIAVPRIGVAATTGAIVAGQVIVAALIDRLGLLGVAMRPLTPGRVLGLLLLVVAVGLVTRG
jgi:transporter family-2 protein